MGGGSCQQTARAVAHATQIACSSRSEFPRMRTWRPLRPNVRPQSEHALPQSPGIDMLQAQPLGQAQCIRVRR